MLPHGAIVLLLLVVVEAALHLLQTSRTYPASTTGVAAANRRCLVVGGRIIADADTKHGCLRAVDACKVHGRRWDGVSLQGQSVHDGANELVEWLWQQPFESSGEPSPYRFKWSCWL